jgi:putative spermidine/putrescine transport system permease protein
MIRLPRGAMALCLPGATIVFFYLAVIVEFAGTSFLRLEPGGVEISGPASLFNYESILASEHFRYVVGFTFELSVEITVWCILLGYPIAYVMARSRSRVTRRLILFCLVAIFLSGGVTRAYSWIVILGNHGLINWMLGVAGRPPVKMLNNEFAVVISVVHFVLPFFVLTLFSAIRNIPETLESAARNLGASRWSAFRHVTLPLSAPGLVTSAALAFALSLSAFLFPQLLGGGRVHVIATLIFERIASSYDIPGAAAAAIVFLGLAMIAILAFGLLQRAMNARFGAQARS